MEVQVVDLANFIQVKGMIVSVDNMLLELLDFARPMAFVVPVTIDWALRALLGGMLLSGALNTKETAVASGTQKKT